MKRVRIRIAYDGTAYRGFQLQPDCPTIEGELNRALSLLTGEDIHIIGASRTDSGVHARGNAAVFDTDSPIPAERFPYAVLPYLPEDIRLTKADEVPSDWHPRRQDCRKTYTYRIYCGRTEDPLLRLYTAHSGYDLDAARMRQAAEYLTGEHDFTSFASPKSQVLMEGGSPVRKIYGIRVEKRYVRGVGTDAANSPDDLTADLGAAGSGRDKASASGSGERTGGMQERGEKRRHGDGGSFRPSLVTITVTGSGFLYNMVRIIAGTLMEVGSGLREPEAVKAALEQRDRRAAGPTAGARGLELTEIVYV